MPIIQDTGKQLVISIPKDFAERKGWKKGDTLDFVDTGQVVILQLRQ